jgi:hypothetical protein
MASTTSAPPAVVGAQEPRLHSFPPYVSSAGDEAIELAHRAGLHLYPWQQLVLRDALGETVGGKWAAFEVGLICPRQQGKGSILEALELAALFLSDPDSPPPLILHSAHEFKTSAEHFRRVRDLVEGTEILRRQVRRIFTASGAESIELHSGARLRFVTRTGGSGRGFSADLVVIDEAYNLTAESMAAVLPTLAARPNPQIWYTSSAGMAASEQLAHIRERGIKGGDPSLAFFEWSAPDGADLDDRAAWAQANPSLGLRVPESFIVAERAALPDEQFGRERLGLWADRDRERPAIDPSEWASLSDPGAARGPGPVFGVATAPDRSWSCIAVAWRRSDGAAQVMLTKDASRTVDYRPTAAWVEARAKELRGRWHGRVLLDTASRGLVPGAEEPSEAEQARAQNALSDAVTAKEVRHSNDPALNMAVRDARWKLSGNTRVLDRKGSLDITPLHAAALALHGLSSVPPSSYEDRGFTTL